MAKKTTESAPETTAEAYREARVPYDSIVIRETSGGSWNARKYFSQDSIEELAAQIERQGLINPLTVQETSVKGKVALIAGERRYRAIGLLRAKAGDLADRFRMIPVRIAPAGLSPAKARFTNLVENLNRQDLSIVEQGWALDEASELGFTGPQLASETGLSKAHVNNCLRVVRQTIPEVQRAAVVNTRRDDGTSTGMTAETLFKFCRMIVKEPDPADPEKLIAVKDGNGRSVPDREAQMGALKEWLGESSDDSDPDDLPNPEGPPVQPPTKPSKAQIQEVIAKLLEKAESSKSGIASAALRLSATNLQWALGEKARPSYRMPK